MISSPGKTKASAMLDLLRGLAALVVASAHWRNVLFVDREQRTSRGVLSAAFYLVTSCGHQAVVIFFVLSGYLIAGSVRRSLARGQWSWSRYAIQRLTRLWVVLLPGLLLCALWDAVGMRSGWAPRLYSGLSGDHMILNVAEYTNWPAFLRTFFFLQEILGKTFGTDGPLWSLAYEFWYYLLFPLGLFAIMPGIRPRVRWICVALLVPVVWIQGREMLSFFPIWLAGAALTWVPQPRSGALQRWATVFAYLPVFFTASRFGLLLGPPSIMTALLADYILSLSTAALLWVLLSARTPQTGSDWERAGHQSARFAYTLYVTHVPALVLLAAWAARDQRWQPDAHHLLLGAVIMAVLLAYAWLVAWGTEFRTDQVRRWTERLLINQRQPNA